MEGLLKALKQDLRRQFRGEISSESTSCALYSTDSSPFEILPLAVACPTSESDLQQIVSYASSHALPVIARGAGTGLSGESLGSGIIVDCSRHLREVLEIGPDFVRVQPGLLLADLNRILSKHGRRIAPTPFNYETCTVGGWMAVNSSGPNCLAHGMPREHLQSARLILDTGECISLAEDNSTVGRWKLVREQLQQLVQNHAEVIRNRAPSHPFDNAGYGLRLRSASEEIDYTVMLAGSEGTLGLFSELTLRTSPLPNRMAAVLFGFANLGQACSAARDFIPGMPSLATVYDRRALTLIRKTSEDWDRILTTDCEGILILEWEQSSLAEASENARDAIAMIQNRAKWVYPLIETDSQALYLRLRHSARRGFHSLSRGPRPLPFTNDLAVAIDQLPEFLNQAESILRELDCTATYQIQAATGQVDIRPIFDFKNDEDRAKLWPLAEQLNSLAIEFGGTICSQYGTGLTRTPWIEKQLGEMFPIHQEIKRIFDPRDQLNPGKIIRVDPNRPAWPLRSNRSSTRIELAQTENCHGCADCKSTGVEERTCPAHRGWRTEGSSPRGMMNYLRSLPEIPEEKKTESDEAREVASACVQCMQCRTGCSAEIDIPGLMLGSRIASVAEEGLSWPQWWISRSERWLRWGTRIPRLSNLIARGSLTRRLLQGLTGLSRQIRAPREIFRTVPFHRRKKKLANIANEKQTILLLPGTSVNYLHPQIAEAALEVLNLNQIRVELADPPIPSVAGALFLGDLAYAQRMLQKHLPRLMEAARAGYPIVCIEPADATVLKNYLGLLFPEESDLNKIRGTTWELTDYLNSLYRSGNLKKDFQAVNGQIAYHTPCHRKSKLTSDPLWLRDIPEANATNLNAGCTGLAIQFGLMKRNRSAAKNIGKSLEEAVFAAKGQITTSECSACRLQLYQWTASSARHPVELLASAYRKPQKFGTLLVKADQSTLQLFARFREEAKTDFLLVPTPPGSTIAHIRSFLRERWPTLTPLIQHSKFAANNEFVTEEYAIRSGDELSIIPPVSGG